MQSLGVNIALGMLGGGGGGAAGIEVGYWTSLLTLPELCIFIETEESFHIIIRFNSPTWLTPTWPLFYSFGAPT